MADGRGVRRASPRIRSAKAIECHPWPRPGRHDLGSGGVCGCEAHEEGQRQRAARLRAEALGCCRQDARPHGPGRVQARGARPHLPQVHVGCLRGETRRPDRRG